MNVAMGQSYNLAVRGIPIPIQSEDGDRDQYRVVQSQDKRCSSRNS